MMALRTSDEWKVGGDEGGRIKLSERKTSVVDEVGGEEKEKKMMSMRRRSRYERIKSRRREGSAWRVGGEWRKEG